MTLLLQLNQYWHYLQRNLTDDRIKSTSIFFLYVIFILQYLKRMVFLNVG